MECTPYHLVLLVGANIFEKLSGLNSYGSATGLRCAHFKINNTANLNRFIGSSPYNWLTSQSSYCLPLHCLLPHYTVPSLEIPLTVSLLIVEYPRSSSPNLNPPHCSSLLLNALTL